VITGRREVICFAADKMNSFRVPMPHATGGVVLSCVFAFLATCFLRDSCAAVPATAQAGARPAARLEWWKEVDNGPFQADTILTRNGGDVVALKGIAIKVGAAREASVVFDTELLSMRAGFEGRVELDGTPWSGVHGNNTHFPSGKERFFFHNPGGLGWAVNGDWTDNRALKAGPLPAGTGRYRGLYRHGNQTVLHYTVGGVKVLELPWLETGAGVRAISRTFNLAATTVGLELLVRNRAPAAGENDPAVYLVGAPAGVTLHTNPDGRMTLRVPAGAPASRWKLLYAERAVDPAAFAPVLDLATLTHGGPGIFSETITVKGETGAGPGSYATDLIPLPAENPWRARPRFGAFDFFPDGKRVACSSWNGDVWIAEGIDGDLSEVKWRRFAAGLYQTLGLKIVDGVIYTQGRDQITRLHDLNGDGEADHYECFNNDVMITSGFHEFSFDLETDREGNFYFSKAMPVLSGGRGFGPTTPHNGTVLKLSRDGSRLDRLAWGIRAPGGVGVSPDGVVTTGENEGSFVPACKITWTKPGALTFNGVVPGSWNKNYEFTPLAGAPTDYDRPLCWLPYFADNSSGSQTWVPGETAWDPRHAGEMLHLSYGKSTIFRVLREEVNGQVQGGVYRLPIDLGAAVMRARFHPQNGQLYAIGFRGWQTNGRDAFQRIRFTGAVTPLPVELHAHQNGLLIRFSGPLDAKTAEDPQRYSISKWNYVWGPQYGSGRFSIDQPDPAAEIQALAVGSKGAHDLVDAVTVGAARLLEDGRSVFLYLPKMTPAMQMEVKVDVTDSQGAAVRETIYNTVHRLASEFKIAGVRWDEVRVAEAAPVGEPGLIMSFTNATTDAVRVHQLTLNCAPELSPSVFINPREFGATWQGSLFVPERDDYTFSLEGVGTVSLVIDGQTVANGKLPLTAAQSVTLAKGAHRIFCRFQSSETGEGRLRLMWSSPQFRAEPVPASAFRAIAGDEVRSWGMVREGREVFAAARCIRCHQPRNQLPPGSMPELFETAPDFDNIGNRLEALWLDKWIAQPRGHCPSVAPDRAADVAAYLRGQKNANWPATPVLDDTQSIAQGAALIERLHLEFWTAPLLQERKHTDAGLLEFLQHPARHHADTLFPDLRLSQGEAAQIAAFVRSRQPANPSPSLGSGNSALGANVVTASCAACHGSPSRAATGPSLEEIARSDWTVRGCVTQNRGAAPDLRLSPAQVTALIAFRNADRDAGIQSLRRFAPAEYAARQMRRLNCAHCHSGKNGIPDLAVVGEKLSLDWMTDLLAGRHAVKTRPWLEARMPAFASRARNLALGLAIRQGAPLVSEFPATNGERALAGAKLVGSEGYSCVSCHDAGDRKALQVFEGQGPNLQVSGQRLRYDYFQRWMHNPQRITPTTIMPRFTQGRDKALQSTSTDGNAEPQFEAIWHWMRSLKLAP
jgi:mono/diheme cytochrome c family protein